jgi:hypothetical protein
MVRRIGDPTALAATSRANRVPFDAELFPKKLGALRVAGVLFRKQSDGRVKVRTYERTTSA